MSDQSYATPDSIDQPLNDPPVVTPISNAENAQEYGFNQALNAGIIGSAPQVQLNQNSRDALANQIGWLNAGLGTDQSALQNNTDYQLAQLGLSGDRLNVQRSDLGIQQGANARQGPLADLMHQIQLGQLGLSRTNAWQQADVANRGLTSQDVSRGSNTSIGYNQGMGDIQNRLANQLQGIDYNQLQEGAQYGEKKASIADQQAQLENQGKMLDIAGQGLGLDRQHLNDQLQLGLQRLGINNADAVSQLLDKMNSSSIQDQILAQQVFNQAIQNSDYYAQFYPVQVTGSQAYTPNKPNINPAGSPSQSTTEDYGLSTVPGYG